jgi:hypothetical protein
MYSSVINNDNYINSLLNKQGDQLLKYNHSHIKNINISRILETCNSSVCSVRETMDQNDSSNVNVSFNDLINEVKDKEKAFNRKLKEYTHLQKRINEEMIKKNEFYNVNKNFLGKTVSNHDTNYFINNFGYTHTYSHEAWDNDNKSCPKSAIPIKSRSLSNFTKSLDMNTGQPCFVAGKIIKNNSSGEYAWVDLKGIKHIYTNNVWENKHNTCKMKIISLNNKDYKAIPNGSTMTKYTPCMKLDIDPADYLDLLKINNELISLAKELSQSMNKIISKDYNMNKKINNKKHKLEKYLNNLDENRDRIKNYNESILTLEAQENDSYKEYNAQYYMYISWTLIALLVGGITLKTVAK